MAEHPIQGLMITAMQSIKEMVDVNTIVGDPVISPDGTVIIPISRVSFGFASGGGEFSPSTKSTCKSSQNSENESEQGSFPFLGGSGAGVSINPVAFMVVGNGAIKLMSVENDNPYEKLIEQAPDLIEKIGEMLKRMCKGKKEEHKEV